MSKPVLSLGFDVPFTDAIAWAKNRVSVLPDTYYNDLPSQARSRAFTVSGLSALDQIQGVLDSLSRATESGETFAQWKKNLKPEVLALGNARLNNVFRTAIQTHYNIGRTQQQRENAAHRGYLMWDAINDGRTRPAHKAMDNYIAPIDAAIWKKWSAPAGFRCRCNRISLTEAQAKARGYRPDKLPPNAEPDKGWDYEKADDHDAALRKVAMDKLGKCAAFDFSGKRTTKPIWCIDDHARAVLQNIVTGDNGGMKQITPLDIAKNGGRHHGTYERFKDARIKEIEKSIRSYTLRIAEHENKISDPMSYVNEDIQQNHLDDLVTRYWPREIEDFTQKIAIMKGIIEDRKNES